MDRTQFITAVASSGLVALTLPLKLPENPPTSQLDTALVKEFVGICHRDMDRAKELLAEHPTLLNAAHDWVGGDFETGLGAASHVGYKDLVHYLLEQGAQANIFTACLFGELELVKAMYKAFPQILYARGPHEFSLLHHAEQGGEEALAVKEYLLSLGANEKKFDLNILR